MYNLTLTKAEREAFDWVGTRYAAGAIAVLLVDCLEPDVAWDDPGDIQFQIPEHKAWEIRTLAEEEDNTWPCFSVPLVRKLDEFLMEVV